MDPKAMRVIEVVSNTNPRSDQGGEEETEAWELKISGIAGRETCVFRPFGNPHRIALLLSWHLVKNPDHYILFADALSLADQWRREEILTRCEGRP